METSETGNRTERIKQLINELKSSPRNLDEWLELESLYDDPQQRREILQGILLMSPAHGEALRRVASLDHPQVSAQAGSAQTLEAKAAPLVQETLAETVTAIQPPGTAEGLNRPEVLEPGEAGGPGLKKCPFCAEWIQEDAIKCRFCGEFMDGRSTVEPAPARMGTKPKKGDFEISPLLKTAFIIFVILGFITIVALLVYAFVYLG